MTNIHATEVLQKPIDELIPYDRNPNIHPTDQIVKLADSMREWGFTVPILIDEKGVVMAGHGRLYAAKSLNMSVVPCIVAEGWSETQKKAYVIADNKLSEGSEWDTSLYLAELKEIDEAGFDLEMMGFDNDFGEMLYGDDIEEGLTDEDSVPQVKDKPVTVEGDIWILGRHRLMCSDSTSIDSVDKLMPETADMVFTDPPYLMDFSGGIHADGSKSFNASHGKIINDKMSKEDGDNFLDSINAIIKSRVDGAFYITFYRLGIDQYYESFNRSGLKCRSLIIWDKGNHTLSNSDYMSMYEPMFYGWVNEHKFYGGNNGMDIWRIKRTSKNDLHPTMKPVELCEKAINDGSKMNDLVLDLFGGSGSTMIACQKRNRMCRMMELDPKYCDVIIKRWQDFAGKDAILESTGEKYNDMISPNKDNQQILIHNQIN